MRFLAIDVETANADRSSICAIGAVLFEDGAPVREWYSLVDPEDYFDWINVEIHGIDEEQVIGAPKFPQALEAVVSMAPEGIAISHTSFDPVSINRATAKYCCDPWRVTWLDSARIARRAWPDRFAACGYGLASVANFLGIEFSHHNALEDARAAGLVVCRASDSTGLNVEEWLERVKRPIFPDTARAISLEGNPEGAFHGEAIVFTGALEIPRREAAALAAKAGFDVLPGVSKKTSVLVVGNQDARKLHGHQISSKHKKAEELIKSGHPVQIITEADFFSLVGGVV
jgi:DNA polymerase III subunit epsilon